ncbi:MAG: hypothetical protein ABIB79_04415 [archaeon]
MKIKPYVEKLEQSDDYKNFRIKYPESFLVAGFFILDFETKANVHQIDFYLPKENKIAAFTLDAGVQLQLLELVKKETKAPEKMDIETNIDLDELSGILADEMKNKGMSEEIKKIIAVVQNVDGKRIWNLNCVLSGMEILKSHVEDESKTVLKMEKTSFMEIMKHMPQQAMPPQVQGPPSKEDAAQQIKKLDELEKAIEKEKKQLKKESKKKEPPKEDEPTEEEKKEAIDKEKQESEKEQN